jgi:hypothetical protein
MPPKPLPSTLSVSKLDVGGQERSTLKPLW